MELGSKSEREKVDPNEVIWVYGGIFPLDELPDGDRAKEILFKTIGFEFDTNWPNDGSPKFRSIEPPFPLDDPKKHVRNELERLINEKKPRAVIVTTLYGGSNLVHVGADLAKSFSPEETLNVYREITERYEIPFFHIPTETLFPG